MQILKYQREKQVRNITAVGAEIVRKQNDFNLPHIGTITIFRVKSCRKFEQLNKNNRQTKNKEKIGKLRKYK